MFIQRSSGGDAVAEKRRCLPTISHFDQSAACSPVAKKRLYMQADDLMDKNKIIFVIFQVLQQGPSLPLGAGFD